MSDNWTIIQKELLHFGFKLVNNGHVEFSLQEQKVTKPILEAITHIEAFIKENSHLLHNLWTDVIKTLLRPEPIASSPDAKITKLFIFSLKELAKLLDCFEDQEITRYKKVLQASLEKDITEFMPSQMNEIIDTKISIDWVQRVVQRLLYIRSLLKFTAKGKNHVNNYKTAEGISGPWANLDLPMEERVWSWWEDENDFRQRDSDIRKQRRYRKGLENYNNDGRVGEGHYWREIRNEPFSWYNRENDSPYPGRSVLFWN